MLKGNQIQDSTIAFCVATICITSLVLFSKSNNTPSTNNPTTTPVPVELQETIELKNNINSFFATEVMYVQDKTTKTCFVLSKKSYYSANRFLTYVPCSPDVLKHVVNP